MEPVMLARHSMWLVVLIGALVMAGCGRAPSQGMEEPAERGPAAADASQSGQTAQPASASASGRAPRKRDEAEVAVRVIDEKEFRQVLQSLRGHVVLVDYWALWCLPCKELFPHTVELHERYGDEGLAVISVSLDDPGDKQQVLDFLVDQRATFGNFISKYGVTPKSFEAFRIGASVPYFQLYDREGKLRRRIGDAQRAVTPAEIDRAVEELLSEG